MTEQAQELLTKFQSGVSISAQVGEAGEIEAKPTGYISTRCPTIDFLMGVPGVPLGGITTIAGTYGSGKSTLCQHLLAEAQDCGAQAVLFDTEGRFSFKRAVKLGVDTSKLLIVQPETLESALEGVVSMIEASKTILGPEDSMLIILDSIGGAPMKDDLDGDGVAPGSYARLIGKQMRVLSGLVSRQRIGLVLVVQPRNTINFGSWGKPKMTWLGERAIGHASMTILSLEEKGKLGDDANSPIGFSIMATLEDTRIAGEERKGWRRTFDFYSATGIDFFGSALDVLVEKKVVTYRGGWYNFEDTKFRRDDFEAEFTSNGKMGEALAGIIGSGKVE